MSSSNHRTSSPTATGAESLLLKLPQEVLAHIFLNVAGANRGLLDCGRDAAYKRRGVCQLVPQVQAID